MTFEFSGSARCCSEIFPMQKAGAAVVMPTPEAVSCVQADLRSRLAGALWGRRTKRACWSASASLSQLRKGQQRLPLQQPFQTKQ